MSRMFIDRYLQDCRWEKWMKRTEEVWKEREIIWNKIYENN